MKHPRLITLIQMEEFISILRVKEETNFENDVSLLQIYVYFCSFLWLTPL